MTVKINRDYTVCKIPGVDEYTNNYEIHGQGAYNSHYHQFYADTRREANEIAREITARWDESK